MRHDDDDASVRIRPTCTRCKLYDVHQAYFPPNTFRECLSRCDQNVNERTN